MEEGDQIICYRCKVNKVCKAINDLLNRNLDFKLKCTRGDNWIDWVDLNFTKVQREQHEMTLRRLKLVQY